MKRNEKERADMNALNPSAGFTKTKKVIERPQ